MDFPQALQRLLGPVSHANQLISSSPLLLSLSLSIHTHTHPLLFVHSYHTYVRMSVLHRWQIICRFLFYVRGWKVVIDTGLLLMICFAARPCMALILTVGYFKQAHFMSESCNYMKTLFLCAFNLFPWLREAWSCSFKIWGRGGWDCHIQGPPPPTCTNNWCPPKRISGGFNLLEL